MQIPLVNGIYADSSSDFRVSYPVNMMPVLQPQGISNGYLRPADGIETFAVTGGVDRGGINWNDELYRVCGTSLLKIAEDGTITSLGDVGATGGRVTMDYSFDRLAINSDGKLWYWDGSTLTQVTDPDLGPVIDMVWVDGYFMTTDGEFLVVTELSDPTSVNPLKYGSSEADPDPIESLVKIRNEVYAINRYTTEVFDNIGGELFPFARIEGAQIMKGCVGKHAACEFMGMLAVVGGGRKEPPAVWLCQNGGATKLSSHEIDLALKGYTEAELANIFLETRIDETFQYLYMHLPNKTYVYDLQASKVMQQPVWFVLKTDDDGYHGKGLVWCYNKWIVGDDVHRFVGYLTSTVASHYGETVEWEVSTPIFYNQSQGAVFHRLELVCLTGNNLAASTIYTSYSNDGVNFTTPLGISSGPPGAYAKRLAWFKQGTMRFWRTQKFTGTSDAMLSIAALEAQVEPLVF